MENCGWTITLSFVLVYITIALSHFCHKWNLKWAIKPNQNPLGACHEKQLPITVHFLSDSLHSVVAQRTPVFISKWLTWAHGSKCQLDYKLGTQINKLAAHIIFPIFKWSLSILIFVNQVHVQFIDNRISPYHQYPLKEAEKSINRWQQQYKWHLCHHNEGELASKLLVDVD